WYCNECKTVNLMESKHKMPDYSSTDYIDNQIFNKNKKELKSDKKSKKRDALDSDDEDSQYVRKSSKKTKSNRFPYCLNLYEFTFIKEIMRNSVNHIWEATGGQVGTITFNKLLYLATISLDNVNITVQ
ncbi:5777_t:CDS:2, partial [Racocetra fulgida]